MTTITIDRSLLQQALDALTYQGTMGPTRRQRRAAAVAALRVALAAPATAPDEQLRKDAERYRWLRHESLRLSFSAELVSLLVANQSELDGAMEKEA